jgi:hypothetical protein
MTVDALRPVFLKFALNAHPDKNDGVQDDCIHLVDVFKKLIALLKQEQCCSVEYGEDANTDTVSPCGVAAEEVPLLAIVDGACTLEVPCADSTVSRGGVKQVRARAGKPVLTAGRSDRRNASGWRLCQWNRKVL